MTKCRLDKEALILEPVYATSLATCMKDYSALRGIKKIILRRTGDVDLVIPATPNSLTYVLLGIYDLDIVGPFHRLSGIVRIKEFVLDYVFDCDNETGYTCYGKYCRICGLDGLAKYIADVYNDTGNWDEITRRYELYYERLTNGALYIVAEDIAYIIPVIQDAIEKNNMLSEMIRDCFWAFLRKSTQIREKQQYYWSVATKEVILLALWRG